MPRRPGVWFPQPQAASDVVVLSPGARLTPHALFSALRDPDARELREKVGVMSPGDGSAKVTTRLMRSGRWLFKSDLGQRSEDPDSLRARIEQCAESARGWQLWHPQKEWFLLRQDRWWWPVSVCPWLTTLRQIEDPGERRAGWSAVLRKGLECTRLHRVGLDLNPSNFGREVPGGDWYYIDDETYPAQTLQESAEFVAARLPEEPGRPAEDWERWGRELQLVLAPHCEDVHGWMQFLDGLRDYPLTRAFDPQRQALIRGLTRGNPAIERTAPHHKPEVASRPAPAVAAGRASAPQRTCIFADVHGNKPALDAVLESCRELGVDSYLFLGDVVGYGPHPRECIETLANLPNAILLRGNHDECAATGQFDDGVNRHAREALAWTISRLRTQDREWLRALPVEHRDPQWLAVHGSPCCPHRFNAYVYELTYESNLDLLSRDGPPVCFYGHSHVPFAYVRSAEGTQKIVPSTLRLFVGGQVSLLNPGSVGQPRDGDSRAAFALWDRRTNLVTFCRREYPLEQVLRAIRREGLAEDLAYRLELGR